MQEVANAEEDIRPIEKKYELPDGSILYLGQERFQCPEALFQPQLLGEGVEGVGMHESCRSVIDTCDMGIRKVRDHCGRQAVM